MTDNWLLAPLRHDRAVVLGALGFVVVLAWAYLLLGAGMTMPAMDMGGGHMMADGDAVDWTLGYGIVVFVMWAVMMVAMMLPSAAPVTLLIAGSPGNAPKPAVASASRRRRSLPAISACG